MKYSIETVKRYETLQEQAKLIEKELAELKKQFIASGGGETDEHLITLKDNFRETVASKADFEAKMGASFLKDHGLLKLTAYNTIVISRKGRVAA